VGLDRLSLTVLLLAIVLLAGCDSAGGDRPDRLLYGQAAQEFRPVPGSVTTLGRVIDGSTLGSRFTSCRPIEAGVENDALVVERIGISGESLTFADAGRKTLYGCDGGTDAAGERKPPWCGNPAGRLINGKLLDPRLDVLCRDPKGKPLAYAWVEPAAGVRWIGVDQGTYTEVYEALGGLPVRIASGRGVEPSRARASFDVTQYDSHGKELFKGKLEAQVAG
jgi:hypothetical protein